MRMSPFWLAIALGCGCTGASPSTPDVGRLEVAPPIASTSAAPEADAPIVARPSHDAFVARVRVSSVGKLQKLASEFPLMDLITRELDVNSNGVLEAVAGLDPASVITLEAFELDARGESDLLTLKSIKVDRSPLPGLASQLDRASDGFVMARLKLTVKDEKPRALIEKWLRSKAQPFRTDLKQASVFLRGRSLFVLTEIDKGELELSFAMARDDLSDARAREAHRALRAWEKTKTAPLAAGDDAVVELRPSPIADSAFVLGIALTSAALRQVDSQHGDEIAAEGFKEASRNLELAAPEGRVRYESLVLKVRGSKVEGIATLAGGESFKSASWSRDGADVDFEKANVIVQVNGSLAYAWPMQVPRQNENPYASRTVLRSIREAGGSGLFVVAPDLPFLAVRSALEEAEGVGHATLPFMRRFERLGLAGFEDGRELVFGLLPKDATEASAACALTRDGAPCPKAQQLGVGKPVQKNGFWTTRKRVDGRWLVLAARQEKTLSAAVTAKTTNRPPIGGRVNLDALLRSFGTTTKFGTLKAYGELDPSGKGYRFQVDIGGP